MSSAQAGCIHPTAVISPDAVLAEGVTVGAFVIIDGPVRVGPGCVLRPGARLFGPLTMGRDNVVYSGAVLGEAPQHLKYQGEPTRVEIGDGNIFRENVTVHRGTTQAWTTRIGDGNFFMAGAHVAHDCRVGNRCILANNALVGGHCTLGDNAFLSGNAAVHQFCRVGRLGFLGGCSATTKDIPPFIMQQNIDRVVGVNVIGMRRAGLATDQINAVRQAFRILYREGMVIPNAIERIERELGTFEAVAELIAFIRESPRGINPMRDRGFGAAA